MAILMVHGEKPAFLIISLYFRSYLEALLSVLLDDVDRCPADSMTHLHVVDDHATSALPFINLRDENTF